MHDAPTPDELRGLPQSSYARSHALPASGAPHRECAVCRGPVPHRPPSEWARRPVAYCSRACYDQRVRVQRPRESLIAVVRAFLAAGVPGDTGSGRVCCACCGGDLLTAGHVDGCRWVLLRDRVAAEAE